MRSPLLGAVRAAAAVLLLAPFATSAVWAQEATVRGRVTGLQGEPVPAVTITVRGTTIRTLTDETGLYTVSLPPGTYRLQARSIGYRPELADVELVAGATRDVNFVLQGSAVPLAAVVATVEAGDVTRREVGVDIASIDVTREAADAVVTNFSDLLNARTGNVTVTQASGEVGAGSRIRVRGINSLTQKNNPLVIVDGVRASNDTEEGINRGQTFSRFDDLNPDDIARIEVVKGPAATALYGSEAAPGVIIVETQSGRIAHDAFEMSVALERSKLWDVADYPDNLSDVTPFVTGPNDPKLDQWPVVTNPLTGQVFVADNPFEDRDTSPLRTGGISRGDVQVRGRTDNVSYFGSLAVDNRDGVLPSNFQDRISLRASFHAVPSEKVQVIGSSGYVTSKTNLPKSGNNTSGYFTNAQDGEPLSSKGSRGDCLATVLFAAKPSFCDKNGNARAAFDKIQPILSKEDLERFTASLRLNYRPVPWLTNAVGLGADVAEQVFTDAIPFDPDIPFSFAAGGEQFLTRNFRRNVTVDLSTTAAYRLSEPVGAHTAIGAQYFQDRFDMIACEGRVFVNDQATACDASVVPRGFSDLREKVEIGAYLQQRFSYRNYLFLTGALRWDDNSALGAQAPAIWSPSVNGSFVLSDLPSWNVDRRWVSDLRLRGAWGKASQSPQQFAADRTFSIVRLARGGTVVAGLSPQNPGNPNLGPERNAELELGVDAGVLNDRVALGVTYFRRTTTDAIMQQPVPPSGGFANAKFVNVGRLENKGFEASVTAQLAARENLSWDVRLGWSSSKPKITALGQDKPILFGFSQVLAAGFAPGAYVSRVITRAERDPSGNIIPGSIVYAPGNIAGSSDPLLRVVGQPWPTNEQSLSTSVTLFGRLRLSTLFDRAAGHQLLSGAERARNPGSIRDSTSRFGEEWAFRQIRSTPVEQAMMEQDDRVGSHPGVFIHDADFIKWRELRVSYALPPHVAARVGASNVSLYAGARNLATSTGYPGLDPESNERGARDNLEVIEDNVLPPPRIFFSGIRVTF